MKEIFNLFRIFYNPETVFKEIKNKDNILIPLLIIIIVAIISSGIMVPKLIIPEQISGIKNNEHLTSEQKSNRINYLKSSYHYISSYLSRIVEIILPYFIIAFLISILPLIIKTKTVGYKKVLSAVSYTGIVGSLGQLINTIIMLNINSKGYILSPAHLFPEIKGYLSSLLNNITLFQFWQVILFSILIYTYFNYSKLKSFLITFTIWIWWELISSYFIYLKSIY